MFNLFGLTVGGGRLSVSFFLPFTRGFALAGYLPAGFEFGSFDVTTDRHSNAASKKWKEPLWGKVHRQYRQRIHLQVFCTERPPIQPARTQTGEVKLDLHNFTSPVHFAVAVRGALPKLVLR